MLAGTARELGRQLLRRGGDEHGVLRMEGFDRLTMTQVDLDAAEETWRSTIAQLDRAEEISTERSTSSATC
jgi:hypothetical protein